MTIKELNDVCEDLEAKLEKLKAEKKDGGLKFMNEMDMRIESYEQAWEDYGTLIRGMGY